MFVSIPFDFDRNAEDLQMMIKPTTASLHFFPIDNADTLLMKVKDGRFVLVDFAAMADPNDATDKRCDLPKEIRTHLDDADKDEMDVVCITHVDDDHCKGFGDFFELRHAAVYQGGDRVPIGELWVPAAAILETGLTKDSRLVRQEARYRLKKGEGVRVFSAPAQLDGWLHDNGIDPADRSDLIRDAGTLVPGFDVGGEEAVDFFIHSPFGWRQDENTVVSRNEDSVVLQARFREGDRYIYALLGSDVNYETIEQIVRTTRRHGNEERLLWDVMKLFHHSSYKSLGPERGSDETEPTDDVRWLFEDRGRAGSKIVSPSKPIPAKGSKEDDDVQPPHRQAANHHRRVARLHGGSFEVTMEHPTVQRPKPFGYRVTARGLAAIVAISTAGGMAAARTPRAG